jgi:hypothetical protein
MRGKRQLKFSRTRLADSPRRTHAGPFGATGLAPSSPYHVALAPDFPCRIAEDDVGVMEHPVVRSPSAARPRAGCFHGQIPPLCEEQQDGGHKSKSQAIKGFENTVACALTKKGRPISVCGTRA